MTDAEYITELEKMLRRARSLLQDVVDTNFGEDYTSWHARRAFAKNTIPLLNDIKELLNDNQTRT